MRIFYAVHHHNWENLNLLETLRTMGHDVVVHDWNPPFNDHAPGFSAQDQARLEKSMRTALEAAHRAAPLDLFFGYLSSRTTSRDFLRAVRDLSITSVNFSCNNIHQFELLREVAPHFDWCWVPERVALERYEAVGARPIHLPLAANPRLYRPMPVPFLYDVSFVGQAYGNRPRVLLELQRTGIDVRAWGFGWTVHGLSSLVGRLLTPSPSRNWLMALARTPRLSTARRLAERYLDGAKRRRRLPPTRLAELRALAPWVDDELTFEAMVRLFSSSRLNLGFSSLGLEDVPLGSGLRAVRLRDFEAPMSGALYLTEHLEELATYFIPGKEILTYEGFGDLVATVKYYLAHPDDAAAVRAAGLARARRDHTWEQRFSVLFKNIGGSSHS